MRTLWIARYVSQEDVELWRDDRPDPGEMRDDILRWGLGVQFKKIDAFDWARRAAAEDIAYLASETGDTTDDEVEAIFNELSLMTASPDDGPDRYRVYRDGEVVGFASIEEVNLEEDA
jgi:hypothetical protein